MNHGRTFVPADILRPQKAQLQRRVEVTKPEAVAAKATQEAKPRADELSVEELEFARKQADDESAELARLYVNGQLACVGFDWLPGMEEKFWK